MPRPRHGRCRIVLASCLLLGGCNDTRDLAPSSPDLPWQVPDQSAGAAATPATPPAFVVPHDKDLPWPTDPPDVDPAHRYSLVELIDIAERRNTATRIAWEQARQAAIGVGIARAAYLPSLTATALAGYQRIASPFPDSLVARGYITADAQEVLPELAVRYLLLDFGARDAAVRSARQLSFAANVGFTAAHQSLILDVAEAYFALDGTDAALRAARQAASSARVLQQSAEAMAARGLATVVDVSLARRSTAQADFDVSAATAARHRAMYALLSSLDLPPDTVLQVEDSSARPLPRQTGDTVDAMMRDALQRRPDLLADLARLRASTAAVAEARAELDPKLSISANVQGNIGRISVDGGRYENVEQPQTGLFLRFDWPLYQGGLLRNRVRLAQSQEAEARDRLAENSEQALRQVALAYDQVDTDLSQYDAATALEAASEAAARSAQDAYAHGVGTLTDAVNALSALAAARATVARAHAQSLVDGASLAFATGRLTSGAAPGLGEAGAVTPFPHATGTQDP